MAHTPGPWAFHQIDHDGLGYIEADSRDIMHAGVADRPAVENIANARLIAAAPELLEALKAARNSMAGCGLPATAAEICDAAIAKATGDQS